MNTICPYAGYTEHCPKCANFGIAWHLYHCPLRRTVDEKN
jgi:hypothetical protein